MRDFESWKNRPCSVQTITDRFGSWEGALARIGLRPGRVRRSGEELVAELERVWRELGRAPGNGSFARHSVVPVSAYIGYWGSFREACRLVGAYHAGVVTREDLLRRRVLAPSGRSALSPRRRWRILERDGRRCVVCGRGAGRGRTLHVDHVVPVSRGGGDEDSNLRVLCSECNAGKGDLEDLGCSGAECGAGLSRSHPPAAVSS